MEMNPRQANLNTNAQQQMRLLLSVYASGKRWWVFWSHLLSDTCRPLHYLIQVTHLYQNKQATVAQCPDFGWITVHTLVKRFATCDKQNCGATPATVQSIYLPASVMTDKPIRFLQYIWCELQVNLIFWHVRDFLLRMIQQKYKHKHKVSEMARFGIIPSWKIIQKINFH